MSHFRKTVSKEAGVGFASCSPAALMTHHFSLSYSVGGQDPFTVSASQFAVDYTVYGGGGFFSETLNLSLLHSLLLNLPLFLSLPLL